MATSSGPLGQRIGIGFESAIGITILRLHPPRTEFRLIGIQKISQLPVWSERNGRFSRAAAIDAIRDRRKIKSVTTLAGRLKNVQSGVLQGCSMNRWRS